MRYKCIVMNLFSFPFIRYWTEVTCYYESYLPLLTIIMNNLILHQKFLNERKRTIHIFTDVCVFLFCRIAFYLVNIILFENFVMHFISEVFLICSNTSLLADFFSATFSNEIAKLFSRSARTSANNSSSFYVHRLALFVVSPFLSAMIILLKLV